MLADTWLLVSSKRRWRDFPRHSHPLKKIMILLYVLLVYQSTGVSVSRKSSRFPISSCPAWSGHCQADSTDQSDVSSIQRFIIFIAILHFFRYVRQSGSCSSPECYAVISGQKVGNCQHWIRSSSRTYSNYEWVSVLIQLLSCRNFRILASLNLPAAIEDMTSSDTLPESIKEKSAKVKQLGGIDEITRLFNELPSLYKRNEEILNEVNCFFVQNNAIFRLTACWTRRRRLTISFEYNSERVGLEWPVISSRLLLSRRSENIGESCILLLELIKWSRTSLKPIELEFNCSARARFFYSCFSRIIPF